MEHAAKTTDSDGALVGDRVRARSSAAVNARIDEQTAARVARLQGAGPQAIGRRMAELDREWDIDRALMLLFSGLGGLTFSLGLRKAGPFHKGNGWLYLFSTQIAFLGIHAGYGWCPPMAVLRRLGFRTSREIEAERRALEGVDAGPARP